MNVDGSRRRNVIHGEVAGGATWSPDGSMVAFPRHVENGINIFVANKDRSNLVNLSNSDSADLSPAWSPDGSKIAFYKRNKRLGTWVQFTRPTPVNIDRGSNLTSVTSANVDRVYLL